MSEENVIDVTDQLPPITNKIAIVIDNEVVDIMVTDAKFAAIFMSNPIFIDVTDNDDIAIGDNV